MTERSSRMASSASTVVCYVPFGDPQARLLNYLHLVRCSTFSNLELEMPDPNEKIHHRRPTRAAAPVSNQLQRPYDLQRTSARNRKNSRKAKTPKSGLTGESIAHSPKRSPANQLERTPR